VELESWIWVVAPVGLKSVALLVCSWLAAVVFAGTTLAGIASAVDPTTEKQVLQGNGLAFPREKCIIEITYDLVFEGMRRCHPTLRLVILSPQDGDVPQRPQPGESVT